MSKNLTSLEIANLKIKKPKITKNKTEFLEPIKEANDVKSKMEIKSTDNITQNKKNNKKSTKKINKNKPKTNSKNKINDPKIKTEKNNNLIKSRSGRIRRKVKSNENPLVKLMNKSGNENTQKKPKLGCNCTNTKCIQMYCRCFKNGAVCGSKCKCQDCLNKSDNNQIRTTLKTMLVDKDELSFVKRFKIIEVTIIDANGDKRVEGSCFFYEINF
jgi:hypothetical protein